MDADPNPVTTDVLTDEHISRFLRHARRCAEDTVSGLAVDTAPPDTSTGVAIGPTPGVATPVVVVGPNTDGDVGTADGALPCDDGFDPITTGSDRDEVTAVASPKKRRSSRGPAHDARREAFYASKKARTTSASSTQVGAGTNGADGGGV